MHRYDVDREFFNMVKLAMRNRIGGTTRPPLNFELLTTASVAVTTILHNAPKGSIRMFTPEQRELRTAVMELAVEALLAVYNMEDVLS